MCKRICTDGSFCKCDVDDKKPAPHKHAALIKAWADGASIEAQNEDGKTWYATSNPSWLVRQTYRIKPIPKPDVVSYACVRGTNAWRRPEIYITASDNWNEQERPCFTSKANMVFVFDGETGQLKGVSLI